MELEWAKLTLFSDEYTQYSRCVCSYIEEWYTVEWDVN